jgi:hypothetical protein
MNMVMSPVRIETKNHCSGEGHQQFSTQVNDQVDLHEDVM